VVFAIGASGMSMADLTPGQAMVYAVIVEAIRKHGMPPTRAEIAKALKYASPNAAQEHLLALRRKGVIELIPAISRGIRLL
jgi:repressor LexA